MTDADAREPTEQRLLTVEDVCRWFAVTKDWVYDEVEAGRLPFIRLGRKHLRFQKHELDRYLAARRSSLL